jgi:hypothetical protein
MFPPIPLTIGEVVIIALLVTAIVVLVKQK